jgi:hypothetical protein
MDLDYEKYKDGSYDFVVNDDGDLAVFIGAGDTDPDTNLVKIIYDDNDASAILVRNKDNLVMFEDLDESLCEMLKDGRKTVLVIEVTDENTEPNAYDVPLEMKVE